MPPPPVTKPAHVVLFAAPPVKRSPTDLRAAFDAVPAFRDALPDVVSPVAALGLACAEVSTATARFVHAGQSKGVSRWILTAADVTHDHANIYGDRGIEVRPDGLLYVDPSIPADIRAAVEDAYTRARGVVEPARLNASLARWCVARGAYLRDGAYLLDVLDADTTRILDAVVGLGGLALSYAVAGPTLATLAAPVQRSLEDEVSAVLAAADAVIVKARDAQRVGGPVLQQTEAGDLKCSETAHVEIDAVRARLTTWGARLGLAFADVQARLTSITATLDTECDRAIAAAEARKAERKAARAAAGSGVAA